MLAAAVSACSSLLFLLLLFSIVSYLIAVTFAVLSYTFAACLISDKASSVASRFRENDFDSIRVTAAHFAIMNRLKSDGVRSF